MLDKMAPFNHLVEGNAALGDHEAVTGIGKTIIR